MFWEVLTGFEPALLMAFIIAGLILNFTPGADFLFITASGIQGGPRLGMSAAVGINLGIIVHIVAAAAGLQVAQEVCIATGPRHSLPPGG